MALEFIKPTYSAVKSVNGKTGEVEITAEEIGAATQEYVNNKVAEVASGGTINLDAYATKDYVLEAIGEIPEPDLSNYATIDDLNDAIEGITPGSGDVDLKNYYTKSEVDEAIEAIELTPGPAGKDGEDYVLTEADKAEIARMVEVEGGSVSVDGETIRQKEDGTLYGILKFREDDSAAWGGQDCQVSGKGAFAFGHFAEAMGYGTAAFGVGKAYGSGSFATGYFTYANGERSAAFGERTNANGAHQVVMGKYNAPDTTSALIVGNGAEYAESNAMTVDFEGNLWAANEITVGADKKKLATEEYVNSVATGGADLSGYAKTADVATMINEALGVIENGTY